MHKQSGTNLWVGKRGARQGRRCLTGAVFTYQARSLLRPRTKGLRKPSKVQKCSFSVVKYVFGSPILIYSF